MGAGQTVQSSAIGGSLQFETLSLETGESRVVRRSAVLGTLFIQSKIPGRAFQLELGAAIEGVQWTIRRPDCPLVPERRVQGATLTRRRPGAHGIPGNVGRCTGAARSYCLRWWTSSLSTTTRFSEESRDGICHWVPERRAKGVASTRRGLKRHVVLCGWRFELRRLTQRNRRFVRRQVQKAMPRAENKHR